MKPLDVRECVDGGGVVTDPERLTALGPLMAQTMRTLLPAPAGRI
jgi:hypothetical protein